jgi:clan AA aspartic protease (TIGR02281 family)
LGNNKANTPNARQAAHATVHTPAAGPAQDTLGLLGLFPTKHWGNTTAGKDKLISMAVVPIELEPKALFVEALVNNQEKGHFILDTGATYMSISKDMAEGMHLDLAHADKVPITTANGRIEVPKVVLSTVNVNGIEAHNVEATVMNFRKEASFSGLLGLSFINQFKLTIDPAKGQMMFEPLETAQAKP